MARNTSAIIRISTIAFILTIILVTESAAQRIPHAHGFRQAYPGAIAVGLEAGPNFNFGLTGPPNECNCVFDGGNGVGYHAGVHLDIFINRWFGIRLHGLYEDYSTEYVKDYSSPMLVSDGSSAVVDFHRRAEVGLRYFGTAFALTWYSGLNGLYLMAGATAGFYLDGTLRDEEFITSPNYTYAASGTSSRMLADENLDTQHDPLLRAGLLLGVGYDFPIVRGFTVAPEVQLDYPLTSVLDGTADWKIPTLRSSIVLRFGI